MDVATRERYIGYGGNEYASRRMDLIAIAHELSHALRGTTDPWSHIKMSNVPSYARDRILAAYEVKHIVKGVAYFNLYSNPYGPGDAVYVENQVRAALGIELRTSYHGVKIEGL